MSWDDLEDRLREMGWTDDHLKNFARTISKIARASGAESVSPHLLRVETDGEGGAA